MANFEQAAGFEHGFWLQILGDHARFIHDSLAPQEKQEIEQTRYFIQVFDQLLRSIQNADLIRLSQRADEEALQLKQLKLSIIRKQLTGKITIHLTPSFINHMVNELDEYLRVLKYLKKGEVPPVVHEVHHHLVWLLDAAGHAGAISSNLDRVEKKMKGKSDAFTKDFEDFYLKAVEMAGFLRTRLSTFPALKKFGQDISLEMALFMNFLHEIEELRLSKEALVSFAPLMADHMMREECYYLNKLAEFTELEYPNCNPANPRLQE
ncbi:MULTISPECIES: DUF2935 domain-containing protein [Heyndrickxia]|uniref:DUF2935 domain-containing protein n=1 Tax=Heyndrickxia faecalis TaxID=2824910 RepID=A0AAU7WIX0_9BACI|nr:DUF2935 domain-containing protein [Heyndrickxia coagulans]APB37727.1 hypothetical protein BIZ35_13640 [Heyndrickxia coagulans]QPG55232.1 DUF2935 domain-containing protein [Heyndrickxia coagulans]WNE63332.1 DUF2935 domain-containing protein [Heyndrickxia coagulans]